MTRTIRVNRTRLRSTPYKGYSADSVRTVKTGRASHLSLEDMEAELDEYRDVLLGRAEAPLAGPMALMECANAYHARASEMAQLILRGERDGQIAASSPLKRFRTGELRFFLEMASRAIDLGSRRLTQLREESEAARYGREAPYAD
jgi:hypothetical protein